MNAQFDTSHTPRSFGEVDEASTRLSTAITGHRDDSARSRALAQVQLAALVMATGDPREAATIGTTAVKAAGALHSRRLNDRLRALQHDATQHTNIAEIAELHNVLATALNRAG